MFAQQLETTFSMPEVKPAIPERDAMPAQVSHFEFWPAKLFYTPIVAYWVLLGLRYGDLSIATAANPRVSTGGLCGESKSSLLDMAGPIAREWIAPYFTVTLSFFERDLAAREVETLMQERGFSFPVVVKPDIGCNGAGVKLVRSREMLSSVLAEYPSHIQIVVQQLIESPIEAGIFYIRHPSDTCGTISSITYKEAPHVIGDGRSTLAELLARHPRVNLLPELYLPRLSKRLNEVPTRGTSIPLVFAGNHCKGSIFRDGGADICAPLIEAVDRIMQDIPDFHFGRIDVKAKSVADLRKGKNFKIIEVNGIGSEATHIWDRQTRLLSAYRTQFFHYREAFRIGAANRKRGWKSSGLKALFAAWRTQKRLMRSYPLND